MAFFGDNIVNFALSCPGEGFLRRSSDFMAAYSAWCGCDPDGVDRGSALVTYLARMTGVPVAAIPNSKTVEELRDKLQRRGRMVEGHIRPGDLVFFDREIIDSGVGIVTGFARRRVSVLEAVGEEVRLRRFLSSGGSVVAVAEPDYDLKPTGVTAGKVSALVKGVRIRIFHDWLVENYGVSPAAKPDMLGPELRSMATIAWQREYNAITGTDGLEVSGVFGPRSRSLSSGVRPAAGDEGPMVRLLKGLLVAHGYDPGDDGPVCRDRTLEALGEFASARKINGDGAARMSALWDSLFNK